MTAEQIATTEAVVWDGSTYYDNAEKWTWLFWSEDRPFLPFFKQLDLTNLLELACGHGRHSEFVLSHFGDQVKSLVMMDILQSNIDYCLERIGDHDNVTIIRNSGIGFHPMMDESLTAVFCYDAMVHFNRGVVQSYLADTRRVLVPGGKALFHHSNYTLDPDTHFGLNPHTRAFMSASLFRKYAEGAGLEVIDQKIMPWGKEADLDCLSLVLRPA
jgi:ubiquinone/menaquinone biosynthesis C-methylase UbiE